MNPENLNPEEIQTIVFRLYVVGDSPKSLLAKANLDAMCRQYLPQRHSIEIIDVLDEPLRLLTDGITITPTLVRVSPPPMVRILGDLRDKHVVLTSLGLLKPDMEVES